MSRQHHYYGANHLHYLTKSVYRRVEFFDSDRFVSLMEVMDLGTAEGETYGA